MQPVKTIKVDNSRVYVSPLKQPHLSDFPYHGRAENFKAAHDQFESSFIEVVKVDRFFDNLLVSDFHFAQMFHGEDKNIDIKDGLYPAPSGLAYEVKDSKAICYFENVSG